MNDRNHDHLEDLAIEQAWNQVMATSDEPRLPAGGEAADPELVREYTELLGLLPYELAPEVPPPHLKEAILARTAGPATRQESVIGVPSDADASPVVPFERPAAREALSRRPVWRFAQAAVLAAGLLGLGYLSATVRQQSQQIALLNSHLESSTLGQDEVQRARREVRTLRNRLNMVTTVARQAYHLRTVSTGRPVAVPDKDPAPQPEGIVYVCGAHQQWYLSLRGLEPPAAGGEYHLWFMTEDGKVDGGVLDVRSDAPSEMEAQSMPTGTHGFLVTLETPDEPEGLQILLGESPINL